MRVRSYFLAVLPVCAVLAQSGNNGPTFVAADVHVASKDEVDNGPLAPGNRIAIRAATMTHLIATAYGVRDNAVAGGPKWVDTEHYDVLAKAAAHSTVPELQTMLRALLEERFQLKAHQEDRPTPVYVLTVAKRGLQLKPAADDGDGGACIHPEDNSVQRICKGVSIASLAEQLPALAGGYFDHPVVDRTGDKGRYDFSLKWTARANLGVNPNTVSLYDVLEKLGIHVEPQTAPAPFIVVDSVKQEPAPNPPGTNEAMPPMPTEFEVSQIRPNKKTSDTHDFRLANGRIDAVGIPMKPLLAFAYGKDEDFVVGPSWLDTDWFDITAKTDPFVDVEGMRPMLQKLLAERFQIKSHQEQRPLSVYALTAGKNAKLQPGDPSGRAKCVGAVDKGLRTLTCENMSLADFAEKAQGFAAGYLEHPAVDLTGIKGVYNFAVTWTPIRRTRQLQAEQAKTAASAGDGTPVASAPTGGVTFFEALEKIGLKMTQQKHPMPVLIIDKIDRTPTEN
jgi:uncharacterized protein (TIGR03435 family)